MKILKYCRSMQKQVQNKNKIKRTLQINAKTLLENKNKNKNKKKNNKNHCKKGRRKITEKEQNKI